MSVTGSDDIWVPDFFSLAVCLPSAPIREDEPMKILGQNRILAPD